jgi:16S rRNA A1518/A1519 N6-dimethyltransferase RsmA/KsgA/DIM1 with predicted DNA glycosylase/AP lyase activity
MVGVLFHPKNLILVEKDRALSKNLKDQFKNYKNIKVFNEDILKFSIEDKIEKNSINLVDGHTTENFKH